MKLAIVGSRDFQNYDLLKAEVSALKDVTEIVSGGADGADALAEQYAEENKLPLTVFPANWKVLKKRAGMVRNSQIVEYCDMLIAFWDGESPGTKDSINKARKSGKLIKVIHFGENTLC